MAELERPALARLHRPRRVESFPFAETIDISAAAVAPDEPSPCLPSATAVWYLFAPPRDGTLTIDLAGSTPHDAVVRLYRLPDRGRRELDFLGCASPVWNGQLSLEARVGIDEALLAQIGTTESRDGKLVLRVGLRSGSSEALGRRA